MPVYEYECGSCQKVHEISQKFSDAPLTNCPDCGGSVQKLISLSAFALKGAGFYTNDYKRKSQPAEAPKAPCGAPGGSCGQGSCGA